MSKNQFSLIFLAVSIFLNSCATKKVATIEANVTRDIAFVSKHATEASLSFSSFVELKVKCKDIKDESKSKRAARCAPSAAEAKEQVEEQVVHLFGPMERSKTLAAPKEDHKIKIRSIQPDPDRENVYLISYDYKGTLVLEKDRGSTYSVILPINPDLIYEQAMVEGKNPCTDEHYDSEGDFWYFWSPAPEYEECRLEEGKHFMIVEGKVERFPNEKTSYPEYPRLADKNGVIDIHMFFGMDEAHRGHDPLESSDINAQVYRATRENLENLGFTIRRWSKDEVSKLVTLEREDRKPFIEEAVVQYPSRGITIKVRLFFGETGIDENSRAFHYFFKDSMKKASIMIYDGHSGLGGHLDLKAIAKANNFRFTFDKTKYQIFFFNSCTSYTYYNSLYFQRKRKKSDKGVDPSGTKNLDIMANGLSTAFDDMASSDLALLKAVNNWAHRGIWTSYQKMAKDIDSDNLFAVIGDEDNPGRK